MKKGIGGYIHYVVILMVCLVLVTFSMSSGLYAKYVSYDQSDGDARVAKFNVSMSDVVASNTSLTSFIDASNVGSASYSFSVSSNSEVKVKYDVIVGLNATDAPEWLESVKLGERTPTSQGYNVFTGKYEFVFRNAGTFPAGEESVADHVVYIKAQAGVFEPSYDNQSLDVTIGVEASQVD